MKKVLTVGVFDLLHIGHIELFRKAKALGDYLIVAVQDSDYVFQFKPDASLVYSTEERCYMVSAIRYVDEVVVYRNVGNIVDEVDFDIFAKGPDQSHVGFQRVVDYCGENDKTVVVMPRTEGISSSELKDLIKCMK
ncbi:MULTISPECIES: adenylyltransferase/cytidyltransferase family protein [Bacteroides]|jgi:glycerol-3-phosphate cytidylyltransferase|uniref:Adenylyltransferase/cytidyltransferase family protein n=1 Tax=Bacteroides uniformis TaxID=820 RepID=A0A6I0LCB2_BACUN|nr:adenylyltransferase/cytidyltransferase family protein [Bacteroides uniformis]KAB4246770.1 adenylyltransferase/cytidyltransferase family protein [Bacteroides uniformis]KAB4248748.1 adenylyltransferase/cytidyltransferase family protein [Bacteroides uniformis]KAB4249708.1 adenylyltransferase/cytidyltransferase family protein [Bacteroides uniformis]KAB4262088.1 adenylyltransferase/cytidyltransferase family protein [Bacteroides uniformis]